MPSEALVANAALNQDSVPAALTSLPDHAMLKIITACGTRHTAVPELKAVRGLDGLCKDVQLQLCRLRPVVRVRVGSLGVAQRLSWLHKRQMAGKRRTCHLALPPNLSDTWHLPPLRQATHGASWCGTRAS